MVIICAVVNGYCKWRMVDPAVIAVSLISWIASDLPSNFGNVL